MEGWATSWWFWVLLGLALLFLELVTPTGFYLLFFGVAAVLVGLLAAVGLDGPAWLQWLLFSLLSIGSLLLLRGRLQERMRRVAPAHPDNDLVGGTAQALEDIAVDGYGQVELRGTSWRARNAGSEPIAQSDNCQVDRVEGVVLWVRKPYSFERVNGGKS
ncbi:MAG: NfeD family protein [Acidobacteria bacterium]|nr:NfeD family protein [Acidobacteriota bacterium]MYC83016.1 NfeD family protein [Acidobacteriota bacterium]